MRIRENLGGIIRATGNRNVTPVSSKKTDIGKVYGVVLDENTPSKNAFEKAGGWSGIGSVYYLDYSTGITTSVSSVNKEDLIKLCKLAKPLDPSNQNYPLIGELITLIDAPSPVSQVDNTAGQKYYTSTVNIWNNNQQNSPDTVNLGKTFVENADVRLLRSFEGDRIYQGRKGNGIRFGSTVKSKSDINEWSSIGNDGDPITIMVNGYITTDTGSLTPNIEEVNKEMSSIYMTSTQTIPLIPGTPIVNPINSSLEPKQYVSPQVILNSDRVTINSKKDEVLLFAKTNIEISSNSIINLNTNDYIHLNIESKNPDSKILLGTKVDNTVPDEPVLLGGQTHDLLLEMCNTLRRLAGYLANANAISSDGAIPVISVQDGADQLLNDVNNLINKLGTIQSEKVFTV
jgi:hypothetical protein